MEKRTSCRAIVIEDNALVTMYREKEDRVYYTFPGGGINEGESREECVKRECMEEFGITVEPIRQVYTYENEKTIQHFFICKWVDGELGSGEGEEFAPDRNRGIYVPTLMPLKEIGNLPLMPPEVAKALAEDLEKYGTELASGVRVFNV